MQYISTIPVAICFGVAVWGVFDLVHDIVAARRVPWLDFCVSTVIIGSMIATSAFAAGDIFGGW